MQSTHDFREGGKRHPGKVRSYQPRDHPPGDGSGGFPEGRGRKGPEQGNPSTSGEKGRIPGRSLQPALAKELKRQADGPCARKGGMQTLSEVRTQADSPAPGGGEGCPMGGRGGTRPERGCPRRSIVSPVSTGVRSGRYPGQAQPERRGAAGWGEGRRGWRWDSPLSEERSLRMRPVSRERRAPDCGAGIPPPAPAARSPAAPAAPAARSPGARTSAA